MKTLIFEFLNISKEDKSLIAKLSPKSDLFCLAPLDKGLSGSITLLAKWRIHGTHKFSKFHVLKIGDAKKLAKEYNAITQIASTIIKNFPLARLKYSYDRRRAVLCQEFFGNEDGVNKNLKQFIEDETDLNKIKNTIDNLYDSEIKRFISSDEELNEKNIGFAYKKIFKKWIEKGNLSGGLTKTVNDIGSKYINENLNKYFSIDIKSIQNYLKELYKEKIFITLGPVHGDLHAQNILFDFQGKICLIDFGWTDIRWQAIDFIWLECSLKFIVCTQQIRFEDFIFMEQILDEYWGKEDKIPFDSFNDLYLGKKIAAITKGIATIRENARKYRVIDNKTQYIKGLIIMATSLNTHPQINRGTILHSIAFHINKIRMADLNFLSYDKLYKASGILWPDEPGRMVVKASKLNKPGYCLDIGCGDGKNMLFLEKLGWTVIGVDKSKYAINGAYKRYLINEKDFNGKLIRMDAVDYEYIDESFDLIVCYGLYHCLNDAEIECINKGIIRSLKHNGLLAFASFNNNKPLPYNHETEGIILRPENHIFETLGQNLILIDKEVGFIKESHRPLVPEHEHSLTWALFRKI